MVSFFVDPFILACPSPEYGEEDFNAFVHGIILLQALRGWPAARVFSSGHTVDRLFTEARYPLGEDLSESLAAFGNGQIQARDVVEVVNSLLQRLPTIEEHVGVDVVLYEKLISKPEPDLSSRTTGFREALHEVFVYIALVDTTEKAKENNNITLTRGIPDCPREISIRAVIVDSEGPAHFTLPFVVGGATFLAQHVNEIHSLINPEQVWFDGPLGDGQIRALESYVWMEMLKRGLGPPDMRPWRFGREFLNTASAHGFVTEPVKIRKLLRACAETVLQQNMVDTHELRTGEGGDDPALVRGDDKAWRRDIDYDFHLHYWNGPSGVEFASVAIHNDSSIPF